MCTREKEEKEEEEEGRKMRNSRGQPLLVPLSAFLTSLEQREAQRRQMGAAMGITPREEDEGERSRAGLHAEDKPAPCRRADCKDKGDICCRTRSLQLDQTLRRLFTSQLRLPTGRCIQGCTPP